MGLTKVFVGNLSFKTRNSDLASEFSSAGKVVNANIITRGPRSLGYGFVELESEEEAQKAVQLMNKKSIDTREINVELARPRDEAKIAERRNSSSPLGGRGGRGRGGGRGGRGGGRGGRGSIRGGFGGRARRYRPRGQSDGSSDGNADPNANAQSPAPRGRGGRGRGRGGRGGRGRGGFQRPYIPREPSKTTLYVANVPFSVDDNGLGDLFKDLKPVKCRVAKTRNGKSKGYAFVEFANEEDQKAALAAAEKFSINDRNLIVKVALTENRPIIEEADNQDQNQESSDSNQKESTVQQTNNESQAQ